MKQSSTKKQPASSKEPQNMRNGKQTTSKLYFDIKAEKLRIEFRRPSLKSPAAGNAHAQDAEDNHDIILGDQDSGRQKHGKLTSAI